MWRKPRDTGPSTWFHYSPAVARVICRSSAFWAISGLCECCLGSRERKWSQTTPQIPSQISWFGSLETAIFIGPKLSTVNRFMKFNQKVWFWYRKWRGMDGGRPCWFKVGSVSRSLEPDIKTSQFCEPEPRQFCSQLYLNSILDERMPTSSIYYLPCSDYLKRKEKTFKAGVIV